MKWVTTSALVNWGITLFAVSVRALSIPSGQRVITAEEALPRYESYTHEYSGEVRRYESDSELLQLLHVSRVPTKDRTVKCLRLEFVLYSAGSGR
jgi:hypothetical protein